MILARLLAAWKNLVDYDRVTQCDVTVLQTHQVFLTQLTLYKNCLFKIKYANEYTNITIMNSYFLVTNWLRAIIAIWLMFNKAKQWEGMYENEGLGSYG